MKYYLYIAAAKFDMLLSQIKPEIRKKVASEIGIDLKISLTRGLTTTRYASTNPGRSSADELALSSV